MAHHIFHCDTCHGDFGVDVPGLAVPPGSPPCTSCTSTDTYKNYQLNRIQFHVEGGQPTGPIHYKDTAKAMAKHHGRDHDAAIKTVKAQVQAQRAGKHMQGLSRTKGPKWTKIGSVPVDYHHARTLQAEDKNVWHDEMEKKGAKEVLKREGFYLGD